MNEDIPDEKRIAQLNLNKKKKGLVVEKGAKYQSIMLTKRTC